MQISGEEGRDGAGRAGDDDGVAFEAFGAESVSRFLVCRVQRVHDQTGRMGRERLDGRSRRQLHRHERFHRRLQTVLCGKRGDAVGRVEMQREEWRSSGKSGEAVGRVEKQWGEWRSSGKKGEAVGRKEKQWDEWISSGKIPWGMEIE